MYNVVVGSDIGNFTSIDFSIFIGRSSSTVYICKMHSDSLRVALVSEPAAEQST